MSIERARLMHLASFILKKGFGLSGLAFQVSGLGKPGCVLIRR